MKRPDDNERTPPPGQRFSTAKVFPGDLTACENHVPQPFSAPFSTGQKHGFYRQDFFRTLYGRSEQIERILNAREQVKKTGEKQIVSVSGMAGIGKTALIHNIFFHNSSVEEAFISGKFDQAGKNIPYSAITSAFQSFIDRILSESQSEFDVWQSTLRDVLGSNGQLMINMFQDLEKIIGPQPPVPALMPEAEKNRFIYVFNLFIQALIKKDAPVILFIDDLQWADPASMEIIRSICLSDDIQNLLFVTAYRDSDMYSAHPWSDLVNEIKTKAIPFHHLYLEALSGEQTCEMICDTFKISAESSFGLCETIFTKTLGNPLFIQELLLSSWKKKMLWFEPDKAAWQWDLESIKGAGISDSAAGIIKQRIKQFEPEIQDILNTAACLGNLFDSKILAIGCRKTAGSVRQALLRAVEEGIISPYKEFADPEPEALQTGGGDENERVYRFSHDQIQQEALELVGSREIVKTKWLIGKRFLDYFQNNIPEEYLFAATNLLNEGKRLCQKEKDRLQLAVLNGNCAKRALDNAAYQTSFHYFQNGISLLESCVNDESQTIWDLDRSLCLELFEGCAHTAFLLGKFEKLDDLFQSVDLHVRDPLKKTTVFEMKINSLFARNQMEQGIQVTLEFVGSLGLNFPDNPGKMSVLFSFIITRIRFFNKKTDDLADLPLMTDSKKLAALRVLNSAILAFHTSKPELMALIIFKVMRLSLQFGITDACVFGYAGYGLALCGRFNRMEEGIAFGNLALHLVRKHQLKSIEARTINTVCNFILHWKHHLKTEREHLLDAYKTGLETGDHQFACVCIFSYCSTGLLCGACLETLGQEMIQYQKIIHQLKQEVVLNSMKISRQAVVNLTQNCPEPWRLKGDIYNIDTDTERILQSNDHMGLFNQNHLSMVLCFLFDKIEDAINFAASGRKYYEAVKGMPDTISFVFYETLARISFIKNSWGALKKKNLKQVKANLKLMKKWAVSSPVNVQHKLDFLEARIFELTHQVEKARQSYEKAVERAGEARYLNDRALALEYAGRFFLSINDETAAKKMMTLAYDGYLQWGAVSKADDMLTRYPPFLFKSQGRKTPGNSFVSQVKIHKSLDDNLVLAHNLDIYTILEASRAIAKETQVEVLMGNLIRLILENSKASKAVLLMYSNDTLKIEVSADSDPFRLHLMGSVPYDDNTRDLPCTIINYVMRTDHTVILDNALQSDKFAHDPHIQRTLPVSILCAPIFHANMKAGILYLENHLIQGAFSDDRLKILYILISQAVVSIENLRLFKTLSREKRHKEAAEGKIKLQKRLLANMSAQMAVLEEEERKIIADDLHDSVSQVLAICSLNLQQLNLLPDKKHQQVLESTQDLLEKALNEIRSLTFQLSPIILYSFGLAAAIEWLTEDLHKQAGLNIHFSDELENNLQIDDTVSVILYRVARELLINVVKHAGTKTAGIILSDKNRNLTLTVEDQGKGFGPDDPVLSDDPQHKGFGLWRIQERIHALNGTVTIQSRPGKGTRVVVTLYLSGDEY